MSSSSRNSANRGSSARTVKTKRARRIVGPDRVPRPEYESEEEPKRSARSGAIEVARDTAREIADRGKKMITDRGKKLYERAKRRLNRT